MTAPATHRGRRAKAEAVRQKALAAIEKELAEMFDGRAVAIEILRALDAAGLRITAKPAGRSS